MEIKNIIEQSISLKHQVLADNELLARVESAAEAIIACYRKQGKVLFCGNGGSAADAQHLAAELSGRFYYDRQPLDAEALHVNSSYMTAVANDYDYSQVYARLTQAKGREGDVLIAISTSGNSANILEAISSARLKGMIVIGMTGLSGGKMAGLCDVLLNVPSQDTPRIQEVHILLGHIICEQVESTLFPR
jgi:D-sedoheptulose 7-phosphate isomerase